MNPQPLNGVRVADFTWIGAGSYTTKLLADFGADVIKVETRSHLDTLRNTAPFKDGVPGINRSGYFADRNTSKKSITLNLKHPRGPEIAKLLIGRSDIVANNFSPGVMDRFGLGYRDVSVWKPEIIYLEMSMQGSAGPDSRYTGFGLTIGALSGLHYLSGPPDRAPVGTGTNYPDHVPNPCHAAFALLSALYHRRKTGEGQYIDFAQTEPTIALLGSAIVEYTANGRIPERAGNDRDGCVPRGVYPCKGDDRWIAISVCDDDAWLRLVETLGISGEPPPAGWGNLAGREAEKPQVDQWLASRTKHWDAHDLMRALQARAVAAGAVQNIIDLVQGDPQLADRQHWRRLPHPEMGSSLYNAPPIHMSRTKTDFSRPAPLLGEHTEEIARELLEIADDEFRALFEDGLFQ